MQSPDPQEFDNTLKALFGKEAREILPRLIPEAEVIDDQNIEIGRTILKADLVYNILYKGEPHILDMELQTSADSNIPCCQRCTELMRPCSLRRYMR